MRGLDGKPLVRVGEVFTFPVAKGAFAFCWVSAMRGKDHGKTPRGWADFGRFEVVLADWFGAEPPTKAELAARRVLTLDGEQQVFIDCERPPRGFVPAGRVSSPAAGVKHRENHRGFDGVRAVATEHFDPRAWAKKLRAEEAAERRAEAESSRAIAAARKARKRATLAAMAKLELLPEWEGLTEPRHHRRANELLQRLASALHRAKPDARRAAFDAGVEALNRWNDRAEVIETAEREALIDALDDLGHAAGLKGRDLAGDLREW